MQSIHPDHDGVVRDVMVRNCLLKPGPEPYMTAFSKKNPFKTKLCRTWLCCIQKRTGSSTIDMVHEKSDAIRRILTMRLKELLELI